MRPEPRILLWKRMRLRRTTVRARWGFGFEDDKRRKVAMWRRFGMGTPR